VIIPVWQQALETQLSTLRLLKTISRVMDGSDDPTSPSFDYDLKSIQVAEPFGWTANASRAVTAAAAKVPADASVTAANLPTQAAWWWFEEPLQVATTNENRNVRALLLAWVKSSGRFGLGCSAWCDPAPEDALSGFKCIPSQTLFWPESMGLDQALATIRVSYMKEYGPGGPMAGQQSIGPERYMAATEKFIRFILAATAWMGTVLPEARVQVHRHLRKEAERYLGPQDPRGVKVIQLRKMEHHGEHAEGDGREYSHRWMVDGHFRQQPCGQGRADRKLIWIDSYIKGPDDKPFVDKQRAWVVNR
jgi:hypothetical protein